MKKFYILILAVMASVALQAQQLPDSHFEDWSDSFNGDAQLKNWHGSNVSQVGFNFTFMYQKTGRSGYCAYVADKEVGAFGITEVGPGYFGLGTAWQKLDGIDTGSATAGTYGGINWNYRPDTMSVWIKRTGDNTGKEDFHLLYYSWKGNSKGTKFMNKDRGCTSVDVTNEESDIRQELDGNECGTATKATQISEGWVRTRAQYNEWTQIKVPIYYMNSETPTMCNVIFSAGNYPNFRANSGLYAGNGLYVDDVELIYSSKIQKLYIDNKEWKGFDPDSEEEQTYSLGEKATVLPTIEAWRGAGELTNTRNKTVTFNGRKLSGSEITISNGVIDGAPTTITVKSEDGKSTHVYKIKFVRAASTNAGLAGILVNGTAITGFKPSTTNYNVELPYGTTKAPVVEAVLAEDAQTVAYTQASTVNGKATIVVTAADKKTTKTYVLNFSVAQLKDNTLQDILVNGESVPGFVPTQTIYKVALPLNTTTMPTVKAVSAYPAGAQTIKYTAPDKIDGGTYQIAVTTPGNQTAKVYKLNFKLEASTYSKLKELKMEANGVNYLADFDPDNLTYYVHLPIGTTALPKITWVKGDQYQADPEIQEGGLDGTTRVIATAASGDKTIYKIIVSTEKSSMSTLKNILVDGKPLAAGFAPNTLKYTENLEVGVTKVPTITYEQGDEFQTVTITYGGLNEVTRVTVVAGDGSTTIYLITFVARKSENCKLADIKIGGTSIENFNPETLEYYYTLAKGAAIPAVTAVKAEASQTVNERKVTSAPGDYKLTVVAESGSKQTYIIHFVLNLSSNANLAAILLDGDPMPGFVKTTLDYEYQLPIGQNIVPEVSYTKDESGQKVIISENNNTYTLQVTAENGYTVNTYTVAFKFQVSDNAYLDGFKLDGVEYEKFSKKVFEYDYTLVSGVPAIEPIPGDAGQQVTVVSPVGVGTATIRVQDEAGIGANTYYIHFLKAANDAVYLNGILVNGTQMIAGWSAEKENYEVTYTEALPEITFDKKDAQTVTQIEAKDEENKPVTYIHVSAGVDTLTYTITYKHMASNDATLKSLSLNGQLVAGWDPKTLDYTYKLSDGETEPVISFEKKEVAQTVIYGQKEEGRQQIIVMSASKSDTTVYTVTFLARELYTSTQLQKVYLGKEDITNKFSKSNTYFGGNIPEGSSLPKITYEKYKGQTVLISNVAADEQQIIVVAENGNSATYTINYTIVEGTDVLLTGILVDGVALKDFDPAVKNYTVKLDERTAQVPAVTPLSDAVGQTYIISYGRVNARTTIEVIAKNGKDKGRYYIDFAVKPLTDSRLSKLELSTGEVLMTDPNVLEYTDTLPFEIESIPTVLYEKGEAEQIIEYTRGRGGETWIKVTAQSGDSRTYHVRFVKQKPQDANVLTSVSVNGEPLTLNDTMYIELPYGETDFAITYKKNYEGQAVLVNNGGVLEPSQLIVMANHDSIADKVYTIIPSMPRYDKTGKLESLKFKNNLVPNFQPDVYNYVVNVTAQPTADDFVGVAFDGVTVNKSDLNNKKKQITLTVENGETYSVCWYYTNCTPPFDFTKPWVKASKAGYKPTAAWKVPGDYTDGYNWKNFGVNLTYKAGKEITQGGANGALLSTLRGPSMNGSLPGMMTLGAMEISLGSSGSSSSSVKQGASYGINFYNTPEQFAFEYTPLSAENVSKWIGWLTVSDGSGIKETSFEGDFQSMNTVRTKVVDIQYNNLRMTKFNLVINSCHTYNANDIGYSWPSTTSNTSDLMINNLRFIYNSVIDDATVDGKDADVDNNAKTITYNITDPEYSKFPSVKVNCHVPDQEQLFDWQPEVLDGDKMVRRATLRNYGEDHSYTDYALAISRPAVTDNTLASLTWNGTEVWTGQSKINVVRESPYENFPEIVIEKASVHQKVTVTRKGSVFTITVIPELGDAAVYTLALVDPSDNVATIAVTNKDLTPAFDPAVFSYKVKGTEVPAITYTELNFFKTIVLTHCQDNAELAVTAADKQTTNTYRFALPAKQTTAELAFLVFDGKQMAAVAGRNEVKALPDIALFERKSATDSVAQTITGDSIEWRVYGSVGSNTYTYVDTTNMNNDAHLAAVLVNGEKYGQFDPTEPTTVIPTDTMVNLEFIAANIEQTIAVSFKSVQPNAAPANEHRTAGMQGFIFNVTVTAADKKTTMDYTFRLEAPKSSDATLKAIVIGNDTITDIRDAMTYALSIPQGAKTTDPEIQNILYIPTDPQAKVDVVPAALGETNYITVTPADGSSEKQYNLTVEGEKSSYALLDGIMVDGEPLEFDTARFHYSASVERGKKHVVVPSSKDRYQTVVQTREGDNVIINVVAEDGLHSERYLVTLYETSRSDNATLKGIILNDTIPVPDFDPMNNAYTCDLNKYNNRIPKIQGVMMVEGQTVVVDKATSPEGYPQVVLNVTAPNGETKNHYTLTFEREMSDETRIKSILLDGDSIHLFDPSQQAFDPEQHIYQIALPVGRHTLPTIYAQRYANTQKMPVVTVDEANFRAEITATAENGLTGVYTLLFNETFSAADSLLAIYADNQLIDNFTPRNFYYQLSMPVEAAGFPELTWEEADEWQQISLHTLAMDSLHMMCQIEVIAENEHKNIYTISYDRELWAVDSLQMIYIDNKPLEGFVANKYDYSVILPAGTTELPLVSYDTNEKFKQLISITESVDSIATKSLNKKIEVTVTAENGKTRRIYTIHFPIELSSEAGLNLVQYGGQTLTGFDAERTEYKVEMPIGTTDVPVITVGKKEEAQKVDININGWTVTIDVVAEDGLATRHYTIDFVLAKSDLAALADLLCVYADHTDSVAVLDDIFEYRVTLPVGETILPKIDVVKGDSAQTVEVLPMEQMADGSFVTTVIVTAEDEETQLEYTVIFEFGRSNNANLKMIYLDGEEMLNFHADTLEYHIEFPSGTTKQQYYDIKRVTYTVADKLSSDTIWRDENYTIYIEVTAQDGTRNMYSISQSTALSDDNYLVDIILNDSISIPDFDPEVLFYTYYIEQGKSTTPSVSAVASDTTAEISIKPGEAIGDTTLIMVTAENGDMRIYRILFEYTDIDDAQAPEPQDVLVKRLFGSTQILVATIRSNVTFALYDRNGHLVENIHPIRKCNPNDAILGVNANGQEVLMDVTTESAGEIITLNPNTIYFYAFSVDNKRIISSGKLIIVNSPSLP